jgi:hypothetical protein
LIDFTLAGILYALGRRFFGRIHHGSGKLGSNSLKRRQGLVNFIATFQLGGRFSLTEYALGYLLIVSRKKAAKLGE